MELQELLGIAADGLYGPGTREVHVAALEENGLSLSILLMNLQDAALLSRKIFAGYK